MDIKFVAYINDAIDINNGFLKKRYAMMVQCDTIIVLSSYICDYILDNYRIDWKKVKLINSGIDTDVFNINNVAKGRKVDAITYLGDDVAGKRILLCPSCFDGKKGQLVLIDAISRLVDKDDKKFICVLIGDFSGSREYRVRLIREVKKLGLEKYILILNKFDDMPALYALSYAVLVSSTTGEASTRIVAEAGAMYRPSIVTRVGALCGYVVNEKSGYLVTPNNVVELHAAIEKILSAKHEDYRHMCEYAHQYVLHYFNVMHTIAAIDETLRLLAER